MFTESWHPVVGYEGLYAVSDLGRVRRIAGGRGSTAGRILTAKRAPNGYCHVDLSRADQKQRWLIHRLVALAFLGQPPTVEHEVNHRDADKANNMLSNLEWMTRQENIDHAIGLKLRTSPDLHGEKNPRARLTRVDVQEIRGMKGQVGQRELARRYGVGRTTIQAIHQGRNWSSSEWPEDLRVRERPS